MHKITIYAFCLLPILAGICIFFQDHKLAEILGSISLITWLLLVIPIGILQSLEFLQKPESYDRKWVRRFMFMPLLGLSLFSIFVGCALFIWILYNLISGKQQGFRAVGSAALPFAMVVFGASVWKTITKKPK
ncbi:hypothetical protein [Candidatus Uabimicrobium sp. HlEnr_7]|uniref:hypothetical protein n=1 Tax=Candidatus Uabimicrobium helgolandensis TaxID=3095367 RepID=UPI003558476E